MNTPIGYLSFYPGFEIYRIHQTASAQQRHKPVILRSRPHCNWPLATWFRDPSGGGLDFRARRGTGVAGCERGEVYEGKHHTVRS